MGFNTEGVLSGTTLPRSIVLHTIDLCCTIHEPQKLATSWGVTTP